MSIFKRNTDTLSPTKLSATSINFRNYGAAESCDVTSNIPTHLQQNHNGKDIAANHDIESNMGTNNETEDKEPKRLVPGGKMPKAEGNQMIKRLVSVVFMLLIQIGIPLLLYYGLRNKIGVVYALVISGIPPFLNVIYGFIRKRQIEVLGCIISVSFILSAVVSIVSGDERAALVRDSSVGAIVGCMFLVTLIPIHNRYVDLYPLTFIMAEQMYADVKYKWTDHEGNSQEQNITRWQWEHVTFFKINMYIQTACWGVLLVLQLVVCALMVWSGLSADEIVMYNNIFSLATTVTMITGSIVAGTYGLKKEKEVGKKWTEENDFTSIFERQQQDTQC
ncbi:hypothetical protein INT45_006147 [Circinella minor]|uniref:Uncharacterized protein n=1 Tax=Circinella minor TaxID=1195481 RepID=A0A8H7VMK2_9FUNG|nr:hypothetical protein INT45_006147 [Circinella minor]